MGWQRSVVATCGGVVVAAVLARYIGLPILVALEDIFVPELDSAFRPEPTHPLIFGAASLAAIGSCFLLGGLTAALAAPLQRLRHAMATGLLVGVLVLAIDVRPSGTQTPTAFLAIVAWVVVFTTITAALGGLVGSWVAHRRAIPTSR